MNEHCLCLVNNDEWAKIEDTLNSLHISRQTKYDLMIVNNTGSQDDENSLKNWAETASLDLKNIFLLNKAPISVAWNIALLAAYKSEYPWIIKMDSGTVLKDSTISNRSKRKSDNNEYYRPPEHIELGKTAGFTVGARVLGKKSKKTVYKPGLFINVLVDFCKEYNTGIGCLLAVPEGDNFMAHLENASKLRRKEVPYLLHGCWAIKRNTISKIGIMDERLNAQIDTEYSLRAVSNGISIGYQQDVWVTVPSIWSKPESTTEDNQNALYFIDNAPIKEKQESVWNCMEDRLKSCCDNNLIINVKNMKLSEIWEKTIPTGF